ncbi:unnamed protein product [Sphenostylis stenocarpa]|uniref:Uncharacterized protein n=1 Tax=Sphenostylis stenocarpa TaxID=92480 RepID=A0AA86W0F7_9FABA|nr:unnamed protein product [Sphenostylis stenocarpa]
MQSIPAPVADNDWNEEIFEVLLLDSESAFAFSFAKDSAKKWKILSQQGCFKSVDKLVMMFERKIDWCVKEILTYETQAITSL